MIGGAFRLWSTPHRDIGMAIERTDASTVACGICRTQNHASGDDGNEELRWARVDAT